MNSSIKYFLSILLVCLCYISVDAQQYSLERDLLYKHIMRNETKVETKKDTLIEPRNIFEELNTNIFDLQIKKLTAKYFLIEKKTHPYFPFIFLMIVAVIIVIVINSDNREIEYLFTRYLSNGVKLNSEFNIYKLIFIINYFIVLTIAIILILDYFKIPIDIDNIYLYVAVFLSLIIWYFARVLLFIFLGYIFDASATFFNALMIQVHLNISLGLILLPIVLLKFYSHDLFSTILIYTAIATIVINIFTKLLQNIFINFRYIVLHALHFIIYICAVEIFPLLLINQFLKAKKIF